MQKLALSVGCSLLLLGGLFGSLPVKADSVVICQSVRGRTQRCSINTSGEVRLIEQLSDTSCRGRWSYGRGYIEVWDGCRGKFISDNYYDHDDDYYDHDDDYYDHDNRRYGNNRRIVCGSSRGETRRCQFSARGRVWLRRQLSNAPCQGNWRYRNGYITVRNGCRGEFEAR